MHLLVFSAFAQDTPPPPGGVGGQTFPSLRNPAMSVNGLVVGSATWEDGELAPPALQAHEEEPAGGHGHGGESFGTGLSMQETELQLKAAVDPYLDANLTLSMHGIEGIELEEGIVRLVSLPRVTVSVGKIKAPFGRENLAHTHALLTIDRSLVGQRVFGAEGLNDVGVHGAVLLPAPWYSEVTLGVDAGANERILGSGLPGAFGYLGHWKNLVDLSSGTSLEVGVSGYGGLDPFGEIATVGGVDVTLKGHGRGHRQFNRVIWQSEYLLLRRAGDPEDPVVGGLYSTLEYALTRRFWLGGRFDLVGLPEPADERTWGATAIAIYAPTEFSAIRLQAQRQLLPDGDTVDSVVSQLNFTIGAHPAHAY